RILRTALSHITDASVAARIGWSDPAFERPGRRDSGMKNSTTGRLTSPLIREGSGHRPASWAEALDFTANGLRRQIEAHGARTFGMFSCSKTTNELNYIAQKFVRMVIGCNNIDSCNRT